MSHFLQGAAHLKKQLPNVRDYRVLNNWNHIDFVYSKNARNILYKDILNSIQMEEDQRTTEDVRIDF